MRRALAVVLGLGAILGAKPASTACYGPTVLTPNQTYSQVAGTEPRLYEIAPNRPFWNVVAVQHLSWSSPDDYDLRMFRNRNGGGPEPNCWSNELANSARSYGTDLVVGDFNYNAYSSYYPVVNLYSGPGFGGQVTWRDGTLLNVNASPVTYAAGTDAGDVVQIFDVYLLAGQKYFLNFQPTGETPWRMLLFRNPTNSTYWAGRNDAVIEAGRCTTFVSPSTAYYGVVVVHEDLGAGYLVDGGYALSVTTQNNCMCPEPLVSGTSITVPGPALDYRMAIQQSPRWSAVGLRSSGDWDLLNWSLSRDLPSLNCPDSLRGESAQIGNGTEVLVSDATDLPLPDTLSVTPATFFTSSPATVDFDTGQYAFARSAQLNRALGPLDVVEACDLHLEAGVATRFNLSSFGTAARALLFRNAGPDRYEAGRAQAVLTVTDTATFVAPESDDYGLVLVHEDDASGYATLEWGACGVPFDLGPVATTYQTNLFGRMVPQDTTWWIAATVSTQGDFDMRLYGGLDGPGYPDCFSNPGASSQLTGSQPDFVVGDFHHMPVAPVYGRFYEYAMPAPMSYEFASVQWRQSHGPVLVNGPAVADTLFGVAGNLVGLHEVYLHAGLPYDIHFTPSPFGTEQAFLFGNAGGGTYFVPRGAALLGTNSAASFVPAFSGMYAIVVAGSSVTPGTTQLWVTGPVLDVSHVLPTRTALASLGPNPTRGELRLGIELARPAHVTLELFDVGGREVARRDLGPQPAGANTQVWKLAGRESPAPGHYFVRMRADGAAVGTRRVTLMH